MIPQGHVQCLLPTTLVGSREWGDGEGLRKLFSGAAAGRAAERRGRSRGFVCPDLRERFLEGPLTGAQGLPPSRVSAGGSFWLPCKVFSEGDILGRFRESFLNSYPFLLKMGSK